MKSDRERDLSVWNNEVDMALNQGMLAKLKEAKTREDLLQFSQHITLGLWYGDFLSPNDGYPLGMESTQRRRMWYLGQWQKVLRVETSKDIINDLISNRCITEPYNHAKL